MKKIFFFLLILFAGMVSAEKIYYQNSGSLSGFAGDTGDFSDAGGIIKRTANGFKSVYIGDKNSITDLNFSFELTPKGAGGGNSNFYLSFFSSMAGVSGANDIGNGYRIAINTNDTYILSRVDNNVATTIRSVSTTINDGVTYQFKVTRRNNSWGLYKNGSLVGTAFDSTYSDTNYFIIGSDAQDAYVDNITLKDYNTTYDANTARLIQSDINFTAGFTQDVNFSVTIDCNANGNLVNYLVVVNDTNFINENYPPLSVVTGQATAQMGENTIVFSCVGTDGTDSNTVKKTIYSKKFTLIDEETLAIPISPDFNKLIVFVSDKNQSVDFNTVASKSVYYASSDNDTLVFETVYNDSLSTRTLKYFTLDAIEETEINVCTPKFQQFYQQIFVSYSEKAVWLKNQFANCYMLISYTKFAYENALSLQTSTIKKPYLLSTLIDGVKTTLSSLDGGLASEINIDTLEFQKTTTSITIAEDAFAFSPYFDELSGAYDKNILQIRYENMANDNNSITLKLYKNNTLLTTFTESGTPNLFVYDWNYSTYNLDKNEIIRMVVTRTIDNTESEEYTVNFNIEASYSGKSIFSSWTGILLSFLLVLVGITMVSTRFALGWFGLLVIIAGLIILSMTPPFWYVQLAMVILCVIGLFVALVYKNENAGVQ